MFETLKKIFHTDEKPTDIPLPYRKPEPQKVKVGYLEKQNQIRNARRKELQKHQEKELALKSAALLKPPQVHKMNCVAGCGTEFEVPVGGLRFFCSKDCRKRYRRVHGGFDYAKLRGEK